MNNVVGKEVVPHPAFAVYPNDEDRFYIGPFVNVISKGAMNIIIKALDRRSVDAAFNLYKSTRGSSLAATFRGNMWERKVHRYLPRSARSFPIRSLDDDAPDCPLNLLEGMKYTVCGRPQELSGKIKGCVDNKKSAYLQPISGNFASIDSIIYRPNKPLICVQITHASTRPIKTEALEAVQSLLGLRPTFEKPWIILFVVPTLMEKSFVAQKITGDASVAWTPRSRCLPRPVRR